MSVKNLPVPIPVKFQVCVAKCIPISNNNKLQNNLIGGVDNIKLAIEYLLSLQDKQALMMEKMDKELRSRNYIVDKLAREAGERDNAVKE